jgi:hypothetical protein
MTHDELLAKIDGFSCCSGAHELALRAVVELHYEDFGTPGEEIVCDWCKVIYPCPTIQAIEKELG